MRTVAQVSGKRSERLQLQLTPEAWDRCAERASALGLSVQLWAERTLAKACVGPVPHASNARACDEWVAAYLASLNL